MSGKSRQQIGAGKRWVVKIGSALITNEGRGLDFTAIGAWVEQMAALCRQGKEVLLVSSGAVAEGMRRLGWSKRPHALYELQAAAAVGQMGLVQAYESQFQRFGLRTAQVLLTHEDAADRKRYLNVRSTLRTLIRLGVIPVINENDTVSFDEIRFGDNDTLGALVANLVEAEIYVILTDQRGLYERDPRQFPDARLVPEAHAGDPELERMAGGGGALGRGGMVTKIRAAAKAARSGTPTWIAWGREARVLERIAQGEELGTLLHAEQGLVAARKQWLAAQLKVRGRLVLDAGAVRVLRGSGKSLLPIGVTAIAGEFARGELVACLDQAGNEVARGLVNYGAEESARIIGKPSDQIETVLGYVDGPELIHRDNLVVL
ncbi:MAG: glutamate 5-kinase [Gammaproteobacteria bacterium]